MSPLEKTQHVDPWTPAVAGQQGDLWTAPTNLNTSAIPPSHGTLAKHDPWSPASQSSSTDLDEFDIITNRKRVTSPKTNGTNDSTVSDPFELNLLGDALGPNEPESAISATKKTPLSFLGENSSLVNLDNLVTSKLVLLFTYFYTLFGEFLGAPLPFLCSFHIRKFEIVSYFFYSICHFSKCSLM